MKLKIYLGWFRRLLFRRSLEAKHFHFHKDESGNYFQRHLDDRDKKELRRLKRYCRRRLLLLRVSDDRMERSSTYRTEFFRSHKGLWGRYFCAYCGRPMKREQLVVDHIIPVYLAGHSRRYEKLLTMQGMNTVNHPRNLTASCPRCNLRKSCSGGSWVLRGYLGRSPFRVLLREGIETAAGGWLLFFFPTECVISFIEKIFLLS